MHELSIAMNIIEIAGEEAARHGASKVRAVHLRVGPMAGVVADALMFSYPFAAEGTSLEGSSLVIEEGAGQELEIVQLEVE
jgi:hydrogenase nickel incorporation protein HypA/HybF